MVRGGGSAAVSKRLRHNDRRWSVCGAERWSDDCDGDPARSKDLDHDRQGADGRARGG